MIKKKLQKLLFVYNANSGLGNMLLDGAHKILSPSTYECNLCDITFGAFTENKIWKAYRRESALDMEFLHKDEFQEHYASKFGHNFTFPIVLGVTADNLDVFITTEALNSLNNAEELIALMQKNEEH